MTPVRQNISFSFLFIYFLPYGCFSLSVSSFWVLAGHTRCVIFLLLPHLFPSAFPALRPSGSACSSRRDAWSWRCLGGVTHDHTINATASYRGTEHSEAELDFLLTFDLESTSFSPSLRYFSYPFPSAEDAQTSSSQQRRWVWMTSSLIRGSRWQ